MLEGKPKTRVVRFAAVEEPNLAHRRAMEDFMLIEQDLLGDGSCALFTVFDGHGGAEIAKFARNNFREIVRRCLAADPPLLALRRAVAQLEARVRMLGGRECGTTLCGVLVYSCTGKGFAVNVGDSRLACLDPPNFITAEHSLVNLEEKARVISAGGNVVDGRLGGTLLLTRALGDLALRDQGLTAEPEVVEFSLQSGLLVLATDGLWGVLEPRALAKTSTRPRAELDKLAHEIVEKALLHKSTDNITVIMIAIDG